MIAIIDYDMGNLHSVENALKKIDCACKITKDPKDSGLYEKSGRKWFIGSSS